MSASPETKTAPVDQFPNKVFVGNLSFKTTDGQLKDFFSDVGNVKEARVITRGPRSLGYGFVAFADEATVNKAVEAKNQAELDGRNINVESARPMAEGTQEARPAKAGRRRPARRAAGKSPSKDPKARADAVQDAGAEQPKAESSEEAKTSTRRPRQRRFPKKTEQQTQAQLSAKEDRVPSETVVFVGNLPFTTTDDELSSLFAGFSISTAHIVVSQKNSRPKGFGFVTFANHEEQTKAVQKFAAAPPTLNDRVLNIKAAFSESPAADSSADTEAAH
ncbi:hypothetical protein GGI04_003878 [Coemansia thaxteri]|uniref:RRM domain-containing protein n=1 Tax=Coemansia thaxteri TaxID=2663907 RepID=A0A9W8BG56_9FUNG|nr:hypothetical protein GGI04_003878 [Coemansia thaxteri]KAJ2007485.1 hypothetical protein H4R26_000747 [Coemansia thaxteri]KAJ2468936.1 hypothetical protein GGI02_003550 [Coemansia sp. RSA 2322]KAJ2487029.1 hypothetical protein EV174_000768 [Coemansia sp. RSA 2320]